MATWIPLQSSFPNHPKTKKLRRAMGDIAVLKLVELWLWMSEYHASGVLPDDLEEIAAGIDLPDDIAAADFIDQLEATGFLESVDGALVVHNWQERFGQWEERRLARRARDRERKRKQRGEGTPENQGSGPLSQPIPRGLPPDKSGVPSDSARRPLRKRRGEESIKRGTSTVTWLGQPVVDCWGDPVPPGVVGDHDELDPDSSRWPREWFDRFPDSDEQGFPRPPHLTPGSEPYLLTTREPKHPDDISSRYRPLVVRSKSGRAFQVPYGESARKLLEDPILRSELAHYLPTPETPPKATKRRKKGASVESSDLGA